MYKIRQYCVKHKIRLNKPQWNMKLPFYTKKVYSSYPTREGTMFYARSNRRDIFIHLKLNGTAHITDGYDGGDLSRYKSSVPHVLDQKEMWVG